MESNVINWMQKHHELQDCHLELLREHQALKTKYDNILATESGHESKTENVWQSGYAAGHEAGMGKTNELVAENERLKTERDNLQAVYTALFNTAQTSGVKYQALKERCEKMEANGKDLALALRRLCRCVSVHPDYSNDSELGDYVAFAEEKLSAWESNTPASGEGEIAVCKQVGSKTEINMSYTKGEWYLQHYTDAYTNIIRCNNGKHETIYIASTPQSTLPAARANAKLMSAAPDLLESLQEIIAITDRNHIAWVKAKAAIEKAIGNEIKNKPF